MNVIKTNYNNAYIKKPTAPSPSFFAYKHVSTEEDESLTKEIKLFINDNLKDEPFFSDYTFIIYVNGTLYTTISKTNEKIITIKNVDFNETPSVAITIEGYYVTDTNHQEEFKPISFQVFNELVCSNSVFCSNRITVSDVYPGYFNPNDNLMYQTYYNGIYSTQLEGVDGHRYIDLLTNRFYKWNSEQECYILI